MPSSSAAPTLHATHPIADARMGLNHWCRACTWTCATFFSLIIFAATLAPASCVDDTSPPPPPTWPTLFSAQMLSNRSNHFALQHLWYDWDFHAGVGRQIIRIVKEDGNMIYDVMPGDGACLPNRLLTSPLPMLTFSAVLSLLQGGGEPGTYSDSWYRRQRVLH